MHAPPNRKSSRLWSTIYKLLWWSNNTFHGHIRRDAFRSYQRQGECYWQTDGVVLVDFFLLIPLFLIFYSVKYKSFISFCFFFIYYRLFFFFNFLHHHLISFNFYIKFDLYFFNCYLFLFYLFSNWILFLISSLNIWFDLFLYQIWVSFFFITICFVFF
jgi:hypothetical protein